MEVKSPDLEFENACMLAEKKLISLNNRNLDKKKVNQRLYAYLLSKGFNYDVIKAAVNKVFQPLDEEAE